MNSLAEYLISVTGAAIVCSGVCCLFDKKSSAYTVVRFLCGVFLSIIMIRPLVQLNIQIPWNSLDGISKEAATITDYASDQTATEQRKLIIQNTQAYIQDKLTAMHCSLETRIDLQEEYPYAPCHIVLTGNVSPYVKSYLSNWLDQNIGIPTEEQTWIG